jgi:hypothetical protein
MHVAAAVREELAALDAAARLAAFESLARRSAAMALAPRRALLRSARAFAITPAAQLRWLALRHLQRVPLKPPGARSPSPWPGDMAIAGAYLAGTQRDARSAWRAVLRLQRRVPAMQRPLLWRQWRDAGVLRGESLVCAAWLLDLPVPSIAQLVAGGQQPQRDG